MFHQTLFFFLSSSYWLKYGYLKLIIFCVTMPYAFETLFPRLYLTASSSGEICGCSAHLRHTWSRVCKQIKKAGSGLWGLKYVPSQCSLIKIPSWITSKFVTCHLETCEIFGSFMLNKIWVSMLTSSRNFHYDLSCFLNCVPRYHCLIFIFVTADVNITWEGNQQNAWSWAHHLCCQGSCKPFPTSKSLAASTPVLFLWHFCIIKK